MDVKKPMLRRKLFISDSSYYLDRYQSEGEKDLAKIAKKAKREDTWIFYEDSGLWLHLPGKHYKQISEDGSLNMGCICPAIYESQLGKKAVHYHIHPDLLIANAMMRISYNGANLTSKNFIRNILFAWYSMPSSEDATAITGKGKGYEHKIITTRGATSIRCNPDRTLVQVNNPGQFFRDCVDSSIINRKGLEVGIEDALNKVNERYQGYLHTAYKTHFH